MSTPCLPAWFKLAQMTFMAAANMALRSSAPSTCGKCAIGKDELSLRRVSASKHPGMMLTGCVLRFPRLSRFVASEPRV